MVSVQNPMETNGKHPLSSALCKNQENCWVVAFFLNMNEGAFTTESTFPQPLIMSVVSFLTRASVYIKNAVNIFHLKAKAIFFDVLRILSTEITLNYPTPKTHDILNQSENHIFKRGHALRLRWFLN